jgi:hypothetical protein
MRPAAFSAAHDSPFIQRCDGCDGVLEGDLLQYKHQDGDGTDWLLCKDCLAEHSCEYCGEYSESLKTFAWDIPATWEEPGDNGSMALCPSCFEQCSRKRSA